MGNYIIHSRDVDLAQDTLDSVGLKEEDRIFWQGYLLAEYWDNNTALDIFSHLSGKKSSTVNLHWRGNLLGKLNRFSEALPFLEEAMRLEPNRYNHHSHLGNVYRGLGRKEEAKLEYLTALELIWKKHLGRVEFIHLVRCYHGLVQLGERQYSELEEMATTLAQDSDKVKPFELERIKF